MGREGDPLNSGDLAGKDREIKKREITRRLAIIDDFDAADKQEKDRITAIEGKEEELTTIYLDSTSNLLEMVDALALDDPQSADEMLNNVLEFLKSIDSEKTLEEKATKFRKKVDDFLQEVGNELEVADQIRLLEQAIDSRSENKYSRFLGFSIRDIYLKLLSQKIPVTAANVEALKKYSEKIIALSENYKFKQDCAYFRVDAHYDILNAYLNESIVSFILAGQKVNTQQYISQFEKKLAEISKERQECERLEKTLKSIPGGQIIQQLFHAGNHDCVLEMYATLVKKHGISIETIDKILVEITESPDFVALYGEKSEGKDSAAELKEFLMESVLRGRLKKDKTETVDQNEIDRTKVELHAKKLFTNEQIRLQKESNAYSCELDKIQMQCSEWKESHTKKGVFYSNLTPEEFHEFMQFEVESKKLQYRQKLNELEQIVNESVLVMTTSAIRKMEAVDESYMNALIDEAFEKTAVTEKINPLQHLQDYFNGLDGRLVLPKTSSLFVIMQGTEVEVENKQQEYEQSKKISGNPVGEAAELAYRKFLEGDSSYEIYKREILPQRQNRLKELLVCHSKIEAQISPEWISLNEIIEQKKSFDIVPDAQKPLVREKGQVLSKLLMTDIDFVNQISAIHTEMKLMSHLGWGLKDETFSAILSSKNQNIQNLTKLAAFYGEKIDIPDMDIEHSQVERILAEEIDEKVGEEIIYAVSDFKDTSEKAGKEISLLERPEEYDEMTRMQKISENIESPSKLAGKCIKYVDNMELALIRGQRKLQSTRGTLEQELGKDTEFTRRYPKAKEIRDRIIQNTIKSIDHLLETTFSDSQLTEIIKLKEKLIETKDKIDSAFIAGLIVFALTIATSAVTGGLAVAGASRLASIFSLGARTRNIIRFTASAVGSATGSTFGSRVAKVLVGRGDEVDWSFSAITEDVLSKSMKNGITMGGALLTFRHLELRGEIWANSKGFSYSELVEAGATKGEWLKKLLAFTIDSPKNYIKI